ncbi:hypothetical protein [Halalkalibacter oceani]
MERFISESEEYIQVYEKCRFRNGWLIVLQVSKEKWKEGKYDKFR